MLIYFLTWKRSFDFSGRSSRKEFWVFILVHVMVTIGLIAIDITMNTWLDMLYSAMSLVPTISAIIRRLHDTDKSGYWIWIFLAPIVGPFILLYLLIQAPILQSNQAVKE
ncbi:DUF805 domain-containing protein [uncultured Vibrio sp.]|uniref:DUF805 domain-containing protein n=1 Tax=uncultured Vibrio sp. TaxID=114054 RepID=UPI0025DB7349|nr:DUF805 domain-containing protein [uncultured Vibrio sp.]